MSGIYWLMARLRERSFHYVRPPNGAPRPVVPALPAPIPLAQVEDGARARVRARIVEPQEALHAPLTGRRCVAWAITIDQRMRAAGWQVRARDASAGSFEVEDPTGRAWIDARGMQIWASLDVTRVEPLVRGSDKTFSKLVAQYGSPEAPLRHSDGGKLRVREGILETGEVIYLWGRARWTEGVASAGYRQSARERHLVIGPDDDEPVYASDDESGPY